MATETESTDTPFAIRSLIGEAGTGSNGEKLVNAIGDFYPDGLQRAQLLKPNTTLSGDLKLADVAKIAGDGIDVRDAVVRGGELRDSEAWVTYAGYDESGDTIKGAFPFADLGKTRSGEHISQSDQLQGGTAARDFKLAQAKADAAADAPASSGDPIADYEDMGARDIVAYVKDHPERASVIGALEAAIRPGDERPSVVKAVEEAQAGDGGGSGGGTGAPDAGGSGSGA